MLKTTLPKLELLKEGKAKAVFADPDSSRRVIIQNKNTFTYTPGAGLESMPDKGRLVTSMTCDWFTYLRRKGIGTHFIKRLSPVEFLAERLEMIRVECVLRRRAYGSYCRRHPDVTPGSVLEPLVVELFFKDDELVDPLILLSKDSERFDLFEQSSPISEPLGSVTYAELNIHGIDPEKIIRAVQSTSKLTFEVMEKAWRQLGVRLVDLKLEFGVTEDGRLLVGDTIDADGWRAWQDGDRHKSLNRDYVILDPNVASGLKDFNVRYHKAEEICAKLKTI